MLKDRILFPDTAGGAPSGSGSPSSQTFGASSSGSSSRGYAELDEIAAQAPPGSDKLIFLPWLYGERSPVEERLLRGGFFNCSLGATRAHLVRSVLEGIALNARWLLRHTERFTGRAFDSVRVVGGGAKSRLWCQIYADVLERRVECVEAPGLASLRGAAALAFTGVEGGSIAEFAARARVREAFEPRPELRGLYGELFEAFLGYYRNNRRALARLNSRSAR